MESFHPYKWSYFTLLIVGFGAHLVPFSLEDDLSIRWICLICLINFTGFMLLDRNFIPGPRECMQGFHLFYRSSYHITKTRSTTINLKNSPEQWPPLHLVKKGIIQPSYIGIIKSPPRNLSQPGWFMSYTWLTCVESGCDVFWGISYPSTSHWCVCVCLKLVASVGSKCWQQCHCHDYSQPTPQRRTIPKK